MLLVSCILPCYNVNISYFNSCINSLRVQTYSNFECIIVDESTGYEVYDCINKLMCSDNRFIYIRANDSGLSASLNLGIKFAKGDYIARFDADDICHPRRFEYQVNFLNQNPEIGVVGSSVEIIDENGDFLRFRKYPSTHSEIQKKFIYSNALSHPTVMLRKSIFANTLSPYDSSFLCAEDLELWLRLLNKNVKFANLPDSLIKYRVVSDIRNKMNWKFNIKARLKNISQPHICKKLLAIIAIKFWMHFPQNAQQFLINTTRSLGL